jgi:predicted peroxiredoxin
LGDKSLLVIISSPPYTIGAVDGMLTVLGVRPKLGWDVSIFLVGDGVFLAKKGQDAITGVYSKVASAHGVPFHEVNFEKSLCRLIKEGVNVCASREDCRERGLKPSEIVGKVALRDYKALAEESLRAKVSFLF